MLRSVGMLQPLSSQYPIMHMTLLDEFKNVFRVCERL